MNRQESILKGEKTYDGSPCKNCNNTKKFVSNYGCVACSKTNMTKRNKAYWERVKEQGKTKIHSERGKQARKDYYDRNKQLLKEQLHIKKKELGSFYVKKLLISIKSKCKKKNIPFDITSDDIMIPDRCPVLDIELQFNEGLGSNDSSPSIDRIIPSLGYVKGNVLVVSRRANKIKNDANSQELLKVYNFYKDKC